MSTVQLTIRDDVLQAGEAYARQAGTSLDALGEQLLARTVSTVSNPELAQTFTIAPAPPGGTTPRTWRRDDSYER